MTLTPLPAAASSPSLDAQPSLLLGDADAAIDGARMALIEEGYRVEALADGGIALQRALRGSFDIVVVDPGMPGFGGIDGCRALRGASDVPLVLVSSRNSAADRVRGLEAGADDYLGKPLITAELVSRVNALIRRRRLDRTPPGPVRRVGDIEIDLVTHRVMVAGRPVNLTVSEFRLLSILAETPDRPVAVETLLRRLWGTDHIGRDVSCRTHIHNLRRKLDGLDGGFPRVRTVRGVGYLLAAAAVQEPGRYRNAI